MLYLVVNPIEEFERMDCYYCGEDAFIDTNYKNKEGNDCYQGDDKYGTPIVCCSKHLWY